MKLYILIAIFSLAASCHPAVADEVAPGMDGLKIKVSWKNMSYEGQGYYWVGNATEISAAWCIDKDSCYISPAPGIKKPKESYASLDRL